ncbi:MAG: hypothetical protein D3910_23895 [Candidatus Electrothrix sp. ATG2]|nr:hypothetical protein [Candidatus Electrothrix sp. ATG2]
MLHTSLLTGVLCLLDDNKNLNLPVRILRNFREFNDSIFQYCRFEFICFHCISPLFLVSRKVGYT